LRFIAHRANVNGPSNLENLPSQVDWCLEQSIDCEVDLWVVNGVYSLGHDSGQYQVTREWLLKRQQRLWIHCKNPEALKSLRDVNEKGLNYFWHEEDSYTLTSLNWIWVYPGMPVIPGSVSVLPEKWLTDSRGEEISLSYGICTDYFFQFRRRFHDVDT